MKNAKNLMEMQNLVVEPSWVPAVLTSIKSTYSAYHVTKDDLTVELNRTIQPDDNHYVIADNILKNADWGAFKPHSIIRHELALRLAMRDDELAIKRKKAAPLCEEFKKIGYIFAISLLAGAVPGASILSLVLAMGAFPSDARFSLPKVANTVKPLRYLLDIDDRADNPQNNKMVRSAGCAFTFCALSLMAYHATQMLMNETIEPKALLKYFQNDYGDSGYDKFRLFGDVSCEIILLSIVASFLVTLGVKWKNKEQVNAPPAGQRRTIH